MNETECNPHCSRINEEALLFCFGIKPWSVTGTNRHTMATNVSVAGTKWPVTDTFVAVTCHVYFALLYIKKQQKTLFLPRDLNELLIHIIYMSYEEE